jgi:hypothetical protein
MIQIYDRDLLMSGYRHNGIRKLLQRLPVFCLIRPVGIVGCISYIHKISPLHWRNQHDPGGRI